MKIHTIEYDVDWDKFLPYSSFFIPALNYKYAESIVRDECAKRKLHVIIRFSIENNIRGLRVWRVHPREKDIPVHTPST